MDIKFRMWDISNQVMNVPEAQIGGLWSLGKIYNGIIEEPKNGIIMQYTGLKDKEGNDIYDGDILRTESRLAEIPDVKVVWKQEEASFMLEYVNGGFCNLNDSIQYTSEVIGNIYENPELIEAKIIE